jgi:hypothetical protein
MTKNIIRESQKKKKKRKEEISLKKEIKSEPYNHVTNLLDTRL